MNILSNNRFVVKIITFFMVIAILFAQTGLHNNSYASSNENDNNAKEIERKVTIKNGDVYFETSDLEVIASKDYSNGLIMSDGQNKIGVFLPDIGELGEGIASNDRIVYSNKDGKKECRISLLENQGDNIDTINTRLVIKDSSIIDSFTTKFSLPSGYSLIAADDYYAQFDDAQKEATKYAGEIYIVNDNKEIVYIYYPTKATNASGELLKVETIVKSDAIIQHVAINDSTEYPVTIESNAANGWKTYTKYKTLTQVKNIRDSYSSYTPSQIAVDVMLFLVGSLGGYVSLGAGLIKIANSASRTMNYDAWKSVYSKFKASGKKYAKISQAVRIRRPYTAPKPVNVVFVNSK